MPTPMPRYTGFDDQKPRGVPRPHQSSNTAHQDEKKGGRFGSRQQWGIGLAVIACAFLLAIAFGATSLIVHAAAVVWGVFALVALVVGIVTLARFVYKSCCQEETAVVERTAAVDPAFGAAYPQEERQPPPQVPMMGVPVRFVPGCEEPRIGYSSPQKSS